MAKRLLVIILLIASAGCDSARQEQPAPASPEPQVTEQLQQPILAETPEPNQPEPAPAETPEPNQAEPAPPAKPEKIETAPPVSYQDIFIPVFTQYVNKQGMVDYRALKRKRTELRTILYTLAELEPNEYNSWSQEEKIALWINAYNIHLLDIIVQNYPIESTRIKRLFWPPNSIKHISGMKEDYKCIVLDEEFTLSEIEQRFFRNTFDEPRIFFAISQASKHSPPLRNEPYYGRKLNEQLDDQVKKFLAQDHAFRIDRIKREVYLSGLFQPSWYGTEFISKYGTKKRFKDYETATQAVLRFLLDYASDDDTFFLERKSYKIDYIRYDWTLNDQ